MIFIDSQVFKNALASHRVFIIGAFAFLISVRGAFSLEEQTDPSTAEPVAENQEATEPASLDQLLGIDDEVKEPSADMAAERDREDELERQLSEAELASAFEQAIEKMTMSADLLDTQFDPGLGTQRVQEDIIAKLQNLIDEAKKMQSMSSSSSSSSSSTSQQQQQQQQQNPGQKQQGKPQNAQRRDQNPSDSGEGDPPPFQEGDINTILQESRQEWGNLPQRVRDMLLQGRREKFSSLYDRLTQEYYKRLAEEGTQ